MNLTDRLEEDLIRLLKEFGYEGINASIIKDIARVTPDVLISALLIEEEDILPEKRLRQDLGADSIDIWDIGFRYEDALGGGVQFNLSPYRWVDSKKDFLIPDDILDSQAGIIAGFSAEGRDLFRRLRDEQTYLDFISVRSLMMYAYLTLNVQDKKV